MIVATYTTEKATIHIDDSALRRLSPAQISANRRYAQQLAGRLAYQAMLRGAIEGITPEEYRQRYGRDPYADG